MAVRGARPEDARAIAVIRVHGWQSAYRGIVGDEHLDAMSADAGIATWAGLLAGQDRYSRTLVVEADADRVVGFCSIGPYRTVDRDAAYAVTALAVPGTVSEVNAFYVHPDLWGTGVADELMHAVVAELQRDGWTSAHLWLLAENGRARRFYERHGWAADGERQTLLLPGDPDEIRMTRPLG